MLKIFDDKEPSTYYGNVFCLFFSLISAHIGSYHLFPTYCIVILLIIAMDQTTPELVKQQPFYYAHRFRDGWLLSSTVFGTSVWEDLERLGGDINSWAGRSTSLFL